jgi:hypothetical protein
VSFATARFIAAPIMLAIYSSIPRIPAKSEVDAFSSDLSVKSLLSSSYFKPFAISSLLMKSLTNCSSSKRCKA